VSANLAIWAKTATLSDEKWDSVLVEAADFAKNHDVDHVGSVEDCVNSIRFLIATQFLALEKMEDGK